VEEGLQQNAAHLARAEDGDPVVFAGHPVRVAKNRK
jgi:hypothetical protein